MDDRLQRLKRLTSALQTRKRAMELRLAQVNNRLAALAREQEQLLKAASNPAEPVPGANLHYVRRLDAVGKQIEAKRREHTQLSLLHLKSGADLRRSEIVTAREQAEDDKLREARYLEQVIDTALFRRS